MKCVTLAVVLLAAVAASAADDWEGDLLDEAGTPTIHTMVGIAWDSKYIWRGFDIYDDESATHLTVDLNLFETGFGVSAVGHRANAGGFEDRERWDGTLYYQNGFLAGETWATNYRLGLVYYMYPELNSGESLDMIEGQVLLSWPNLLAIPGLQPGYAMIAMGQAENGSILPDNTSGLLHIGMLDYGFSIPGFVPGTTEQVITLHAEVVYNDGVTITPRRPRNDWTVVYRNPDHDFSHAVFGASTDFPLGAGGNLLITPSVYYQTTLNDTINEDESEFWVNVGLKYIF